MTKLIQEDLNRAITMKESGRKERTTAIKVLFPDSSADEVFQLLSRKCPCNFNCSIMNAMASI